MTDPTQPGGAVQTTDDAHTSEMADAVASMKRKLAEIEKQHPRRRPRLRLVRPSVRVPKRKPQAKREAGRMRREQRQDQRKQARNRKSLARRHAIEDARTAVGNLLYTLRPRIPEKLRGTSQRAQKRRLGLFLLGLAFVSQAVVVYFLGSEAARLRWASVGVGVLGMVLLVLWFAARPIAKVTWRAWLAAFVHGAGERRHAVNASGHPSDRARRSALNRAAWAAQRTRDGRAAAPQYSRRHNDHADARKTARRSRAAQDGLQPEPTKAELRARETWTT